MGRRLEDIINALPADRQDRVHAKAQIKESLSRRGGSPPPPEKTAAQISIDSIAKSPPNLSTPPAPRQSLISSERRPNLGSTRSQSGRSQPIRP